MIDETLAKKAHENRSYSSYKEGSATNEYNSMIQEASAKIEKAKSTVSDNAKLKLDSLFERYKVDLANWINKHNASAACHVSVMIAGPANYNMKKHNKWLSREGKLWEEYNHINSIDDEISKIKHNDNVIRSDDDNAIEKLKEKLDKALEEHDRYKAYNVKARKEGKEQLPAYVLQNSNGRIKQIKDRIKKLESKG